MFILLDGGTLVSVHRAVCTQLISRNQPQIRAWANLVSAAAEKSLLTQGQPSLHARLRIWVSCRNPSGALGALTSPCPPAAGDAVTEGKFLIGDSPIFLLIPVVPIFPFRARQQFCLGLEWSAGSCDGAQNVVYLQQTEKSSCTWPMGMSQSSSAGPHRQIAFRGTQCLCN